MLDYNLNSYRGQWGAETWILRPDYSPPVHLEKTWKWVDTQLNSIHVNVWVCFFFKGRELFGFILVFNSEAVRVHGGACSLIPHTNLEAPQKALQRGCHSLRQNWLSETMPLPRSNKVIKFEFHSLSKCGTCLQTGYTRNITAQPVEDSCLRTSIGQYFNEQNLISISQLAKHTIMFPVEAATSLPENN